VHFDEELIPQIEAVAARSRSLLNDGKTAESVDAIRDLIAIDSEDINVCICASAQLIDAGTALNDISLVEEGSAMIERVLAEFPDSRERMLIQFQYNLSNAYAAKYQFYRKQGATAQAEENLQQQKHLLQSILLRREHIPADLEPAVLANYANTLDHLNRTFEAIDQYLDCLRIEPTHGLAMGNCAAAIRRIVFMTEQHRLSNLQACWDLSYEAVAKPTTVLEWSGPEALEHLEEAHRRLRHEIEQGLTGGLAALDEFRQHRDADHPTQPSPEWIEQVRQDRLLLTLRQLPLDSVHETLDDAFFDSLTYGMSDGERSKSIELIHLFNAIKEEFVTARHLYYLADSREESLTSRNDVTLYGDPEGDAEFGLISGLLKAAFRGSIDLLDKIAVFLAQYFELEGSPDRFNFNNVWFEGRNPKKGLLHPKLEAALSAGNYPLVGLRDFQRDFFRQEYPGPVKSTRNAAVHRWLRLSWLPIEQGSQDGRSWNLDDFSELTLFMLRQARAAILLLTAAVNIEERHRKASEEDPRRVAIPTPLLIRKPISARAADDLSTEDLDPLVEDEKPE
jgi:hypothetical protein